MFFFILQNFNSQNKQGEKGMGKRERVSKRKKKESSSGERESEGSDKKKARK